MTLSALAKRFGGIVRPICLAVFRLITSSNLVGCSMGRSTGKRFSPRSRQCFCVRKGEGVLQHVHSAGSLRRGDVLSLDVAELSKTLPDPRHEPKYTPLLEHSGFFISSLRRHNCCRTIASHRTASPSDDR